MIVIISEDAFLKNKSKLLKSKRDYDIIDGVGSNAVSSESSYANDKKEGYIEALVPDSKVFRKEVPIERRNELIKKYLKRPQMTSVIATAVSMQLTDEDCNIFVVVKNKVMKNLGKKLTKRFIKVINLDEDDGSAVVCYDFMEADNFSSETNFRDSLINEIEKIDRKIDDITDDLENSYWEFFDEDDKTTLEKKLKKLRKKRSEIARALDNDEIVITDTTKNKSIIKNSKLSKSAIKKMKKFFLNWKKSTDDDEMRNMNDIADDEDDD